jgi:hypothetical protein
MVQLVSQVFRIRGSSNYRELREDLEDLDTFPFDPSDVFFCGYKVPVVWDILHSKDRTKIGYELINQPENTVMLVADSLITGPESLYFCALLESEEETGKWMRKMPDGKKCVVLREYEEFCLTASPVLNFI